MVDCTPDPNLLESMRSVGYSLNTAVADIIDNSIAAHAKTISIRYFDHGEDPYGERTRATSMWHAQYAPSL